MMHPILAEPYTLTPTQLATFTQNGFLVLRDMFPAALITDIQRWTHEISSLPAYAPGKWMTYLESLPDGTPAVCRTENFADFHASFGALLRSRRVLGLLSQLSGEEMVLFKEKINYKRAGAGGFDAHIDAPAYSGVDVRSHLTVNIAVDPATPHNGCLQVVPRSHTQTIPIDENNCITAQWGQTHDWVDVELQPGDVLVFGSLLAHRSARNTSTHSRAAVYATYNAQSEGDKRGEYYAKRRKDWPPTLERVHGERYEVGAKMYGFGSPMRGAERFSRLSGEREGVDVAA
ncbi:related to Phytanoyl-CoA dioxygenase [Sporisorium reilianum SRZ2]|uniref:Related to Phytanoyl-CoA dioxygenase n=1 Tax=Sporisorium reilianum (strain SRZ2) TaxID=999809 RepID=E7A139_SPORE|nr:related to Phytanoyl-CoA dioxygenase [Sporisorium reilianum SRZ2]